MRKRKEKRDVSEFSGRVFIHIGPHKTGTSSIQSFMSSNYESLINHGILYPQGGRWDGERLRPMHHPLALSILNGEEEKIFNYCININKELQNSLANTMVISTEVLSRETNTSEIFTRVQALFPKAKRKWILYLRRQDHLIMSRYSEHVKRGILKWPQDIFSLNKELYLNHECRIDKLKKVLKGDDLLINSYDENRSNIIPHFADTIGVDSLEELEMPAWRNKSLSWGEIEALRVFNALPAPFCKFGRKVILKLSREARKWNVSLFSRYEPLTTEQKREILDKYKESNKKIGLVIEDI